MNNQKVLVLIKNSVNHSRFKYIDIKYHFIHKIIIKEIIWLKYIIFEDIIMNFLMKSLKCIQLQRFYFSLIWKYEIMNEVIYLMNIQDKYDYYWIRELL